MWTTSVTIELSGTEVWECIGDELIGDKSKGSMWDSSIIESSQLRWLFEVLEIGEEWKRNTYSLNWTSLLVKVVWLSKSYKRYPFLPKDILKHTFASLWTKFISMNLAHSSIAKAT